MPSGKGTAVDGSRPSKGVHGGTTKSSTVVKRLLKKINGLSSVDKKELATTLMVLALIEDEQHENSFRTNSKPGKSAPKKANGGGGAYRRRSRLLEHSQVQTRVLKLHPKGTDDSEEVNRQEETVRRPATGT